MGTPIPDSASGRLIRPVPTGCQPSCRLHLVRELRSPGSFSAATNIAEEAYTYCSSSPEKSLGLIGNDSGRNLPPLPRQRLSSSRLFGNWPGRLRLMPLALPRSRTRTCFALWGALRKGEGAFCPRLTLTHQGARGIADRAPEKSDHPPAPDLSQRGAARASARCVIRQLRYSARMAQPSPILGSNFSSKGPGMPFASPYFSK
jgi:hypothetical protein